MKNFETNNVPISMPVPADSLDSDPQQLEALRNQIKRDSQARFEELANEDMLPRGD